MCLGIPAKIIKIENNIAEVKVGKVTRKASLALLKGAKTGEYVLLHAGFAIQKINEKEAKETLKLLHELL